MRDDQLIIGFSYTNPEDQEVLTHNVTYGWFKNKGNKTQKIRLTDESVIIIRRKDNKLTLSCQTIHVKNNTTVDSKTITAAHVDITIHQTIPAKELHIYTKGQCTVSAPLDLTEGGYFYAKKIQIDQKIFNKTYITLATSLEEDCSILINQDVETKKLRLRTPILLINALVNANNAEFFDCKFKITDKGKLALGDSVLESSISIKEMTCAGVLELLNTQIQSSSTVEFLDNSKASLTNCQLFLDSLTVHKQAIINGSDGYIEIAQTIIVHGIVSINRLTFIGYFAQIYNIFWGEERLQAQVTKIKNYGVFASNFTIIRSNFALCANLRSQEYINSISAYFKQKYSPGTFGGETSLQLFTACTVSIGGTLQGSDITQATGAWINTGYVHAFEFKNNPLTPIYLDIGMHFGYFPANRSDYYNPSKIANLMLRTAKGSASAEIKATAHLISSWPMLVGFFNASNQVLSAAVYDSTFRPYNEPRALTRLISNTYNTAREELRSLAEQVKFTAQWFARALNPANLIQMLEGDDLLEWINGLLRIKGYYLLGNTIYTVATNVPAFVNEMHANFKRNPRSVSDNMSDTLPKHDEFSVDSNKEFESSTNANDFKDTKTSNTQTPESFSSNTKESQQVPNHAENIAQNEATFVKAEPSTTNAAPSAPSNTRPARRQMTSKGVKGSFAGSNVVNEVNKKISPTPSVPVEEGRIHQSHFTPVPGMDAVRNFNFEANLNNFKAANIPSAHNFSAPNISNFTPPPSIPALNLNAQNIQNIQNSVNAAASAAVHQPPLTHNVTDSRSNVFTAPPVLPTSQPEKISISSFPNTEPDLSNLHLPNKAPLDLPKPDISASESSGLSTYATNYFKPPHSDLAGQNNSSARDQQAVSEKFNSTAASTSLEQPTNATNTDFKHIEPSSNIEHQSNTSTATETSYMKKANPDSFLQASGDAVRGLNYLSGAPIAKIERMQPKASNSAQESIEQPGYFSDEEVEESFDHEARPPEQSRESYEDASQKEDEEEDNSHVPQFNEEETKNADNLDQDEPDNTHDDWYEPTWIDLDQNLKKVGAMAAEFVSGLMAGTAINGVIFKLSNIKYLGTLIRGAGLLGAGVLVAEAFNIAADFEQDNFMYTEEYDDIAINPFIPDERKSELFNESIARQAKARKEAETLIDLATKFKENPRIFGFGVGSFLTIEKLPGSTFAFNSFMKLKFRSPFKSIANDRHIEYLSKVVKAPVGVEHIELVTGGAHGYENFYNARAMASIRANLGEDAIPYLAEVGPHKGNVFVGMSTKDKNCLWRIDVNDKVPPGSKKIPHINWRFTDPSTKKIYYGAINIDMEMEEYWELINHFPRKLRFIGE